MRTVKTAATQQIVHSIINKITHISPNSTCCITSRHVTTRY